MRDPNDIRPKGQRRRVAPKGAWSKVPLRATQDRRLPNVWRILNAVCYHARTTGMCWSGYLSLADETRMRPTEASRALGELVAWRYLRAEPLDEAMTERIFAASRNTVKPDRRRFVYFPIYEERAAMPEAANDGEVEADEAA